MDGRVFDTLEACIAANRCPKCLGFNNCDHFPFCSTRCCAADARRVAFEEVIAGLRLLGAGMRDAKGCALPERYGVLESIDFVEKLR